MGEEDKGLDISQLSRAIAEELKKLNQEKPSAPATPGDMEREVKTVSWNCPECGAKIKEGAKYCPECGVELIWEE